MPGVSSGIPSKPEVAPPQEASTLTATNMLGQTLPIPLPDQHTRIVVPDSPDEMDGAELWRQKYVPERRADGSEGFPFENMTQDLRLDSLVKATVVYVLCRKPDKKTRRPRMPELQPIGGKSEDGARLHKKLEPEEYLEQYHLYGPVKIDPDHWDQHASRYAHSLRRASFCDAFIPLALPWQGNWIDGDGSKRDNKLPMHLRFV